MGKGASFSINGFQGVECERRERVLSGERGRVVPGEAIGECAKVARPDKSSVLQPLASSYDGKMVKATRYSGLLCTGVSC